MKEILLLIGMPGSGKTYLGQSLLRDDGVFLDDFSLLGFDKLIENRNKEQIIIADVYFCIEEQLNRAKIKLNLICPDHKITLFYFENNYDKCIKNVKKRNDGRKVEGLIKQLSKIYRPPPDEIILIHS